jgi:hypothetical protein
MFNLFKVTTFLHSVPSFASDHNLRLAPQQEQSAQQSLSYSPKKDRRASPTSKGQERQSKGKGKGNNKDNDDNDNNNGGFLEPIIEDLQGFLKGRRSPVLNV